MTQDTFIQLTEGGDEMYTILRELLSDKKGDVIFTCFGIWHLCFIVIFFAIILFSYLYLKNKSNHKRKGVIEFFVNFSFGLYIADFFLMPFAYGEIDVEKLPFHICTAMCVMCFGSRHNKFLNKYKLQFATLSFISNLVYLIYPAGIMWYGVHPLSYRVIQTLLFHGFMAIYGVLVLIFEHTEFEWKRCYRDFIVIVSMTLWALFGNILYNSELRVYNWFFVMQDPFNLFDRNIAPYIMPFLNIILFFIVEILIYSIFFKINRVKNKN